MPLVSPQELQKLQNNPANIRNVCIVAHVDHGKTTIADCLISTNGIISQRSAGKLRYMDNTAYEQARGITVKSSCISLQYISKRAHGASGASKSGAEATSSSATTEAASSTSAQSQSYLVNLIDSPGHMDFSGEVSSALRMTDGCFLVVDAIEGVCIQTRAVLRQAWLEKVRPTLVINKIDKLFSQLQLSPEEAYRQLLRIVEQVNLVLGELWVEEQINQADSAHLATAKKVKKSHGEEGAEEEGEGVTIDVDAALDSDGLFGESVAVSMEDAAEFEFSPEKGNVVFASAFHGWGFSIEDFVEMYATKLKMNRTILRKTLWGEYYYNPKTRKIATKKPNSSAQTMFASLVLSNIHQIYTAILGTADDMANAQSHKGYSSLTHRDVGKLEKIDKALQLSVPPRELKNEDSNTAIQAFMGRWLPISTALLELAVGLPSPIEAQKERISVLWHKSTHDLSSGGIKLQNALQHSLSIADRSPEAPIIAYVSKVFAVPNEQFAKNAKIRLEPGRKTLIAMTRLFSGTLKTGDNISILNARYNPAHPEKHATSAKIPQLWMLMGPDLHAIDQVQAGAVFGIGAEHLDLLLSSSGSDVIVSAGTEKDGANETSTLASSSDTAVSSKSTSGDSVNFGAKTEKPPARLITSAERNAFVSHIVKTATLTNVPGCPAFGALNKHVNPIVRVAVEPESPADLQTLEAGMWLLHQADAAVHVEVQENGEFIIGALGELHLTRCLELLKDDFAKVAIKVSKPIVSFRETVLPGLSIDPETKIAVPTELIVERSADRQVSVVLRLLRLPENITAWLEKHADLTRVVHKLRQGLQQQQQGTETTAESAQEQLFGGPGDDIIAKWSSALKAEFLACESQEWRQQADFVWSFGPHRIGPNVLLNNIPKFSTSPFWRNALDQNVMQSAIALPKASEITEEFVSTHGHPKETLAWFGLLQQLDSAIRSGFQLATRSGPLCEEPLMGVAVQILDINITATPQVQEDAPKVPTDSFLLPEMRLSYTPEPTDVALRQQLTSGSHGSFGEAVDEAKMDALWAHCTERVTTGSAVVATRIAIRRAFSARPQRLYEAMYLAHVQVSAIHMGKAYAVLNRRRGIVLSDDVNESSGLTLVVALVPAAEAFGFSEELVAKSGGAANAQLTFAEWRELDVDPNFVPSTEEELEEFGENLGGIAPNLARKYVDGVRKRKGLAVHEKLVEGANKQRTLSKKK